jgi:O-methyltransferase involved in polyketide biosynthesis
VPVDFEAGGSWREGLLAAGFDAGKPAIVVSTGVSMYLTREANAATLREVAKLAPGSSFAMSFLLPLDLTNPGLARAAQGAKASGTPFISFFTPNEVVRFAQDCGLSNAHHVSAGVLADRYFADRTDGLRPSPNSEDLLVAGA